MRTLLRHGAAQFKLELTDNQLDQFESYAEALTLWNQRVNLTRITAPDEVAIKHFLDSLSVTVALPGSTTGLTVIDIGSGAGFPGIPLKIALPHLRPTLLETTGKKTAFLEHLIDTLKLQHVTVLKARAELAGQEDTYREQYSVAVARAVGSLAVLAEYMLPFVKVGGLVIAQKGHFPQQEIQEAAHALQLLGGKIKQVLSVTVPGLDGERHLVCVQKVTRTPRQYPRRAGTPAKKPL
jgi:16S rRNA (guanine527-N7)-methyltransferase